MATRVWGSWTATAGGVRYRLGLDYERSGTNIKVVQYVAESIGFVQDTVKLTRTGTVTGSMSWLFSRSTAGVSAIPGSGFTYTGTYGKTYTFGGYLSEMAYGHSPSVSVAIAIPAGTPSAPGKPTFTSISPTSLNVNWAAPSNNAGSAIEEYAIGRSVGSYVANEVTTLTGSTSRSRAFTGLVPGEVYTFRIRARNGVNWGAWSAAASVRTQYGVWVKVSGIWKLAAPFVKYNGVWRPAVPMVKQGGTWKPTS